MNLRSSEMEAAKGRRRTEWRAAGKKKADRLAWVIAIAATLFVIGVTLMAGHLRKDAAPGTDLGPNSFTPSTYDGP